MRQFSNSDDRRRYRPLDYSQYDAIGGQWAQAAAGLILFFAILIAWRAMSKLLPEDGWLKWLLLQAACLALAAGVLLVIDVAVRKRWGWDRVRLGVFLGLLAVAGFWIVRLSIWGIVYWIGSKALAPAGQ